MVTSDDLRMPGAEVAYRQKLAFTDRRIQRVYLLLGVPTVTGVHDVKERNTVPSDANLAVIESLKALRQFELVNIHGNTLGACSDKWR
jgi:hypothetical protein